MYRPRTIFLLVLLPLLWGAVPSHASDNPGMPSASAIESLFAGPGDLTIAGRHLNRGPLETFYEKRGFRPVWNADLRAQLDAALADAPSHGLDPGAFAVPPADPARSELLMTDAFLRYANALGRGRVNPSQFETDWVIPAPNVDVIQALNRAPSDGVGPALAALAPTDSGYDRLRQAYARYKDYVHAQAWKPIALAMPLRPGDNGADVVTLRQRLAAEGFAIDAASPEFDSSLADAVTRFQVARGLPGDGNIGRATLTALNISPGERMREIRLNLERWRLLPRERPASRVEVNVADPSAVLFADGAPALTMRVVVGTIDHPTPVLRARMSAVLLNPPWIIPFSIIQNEIRPAIKADPDYLAKNDMVYVDVNGGQQLQQRPGAKNALGKIKFEMPNGLDIYLHDTSAPLVFGRSRRALSHGCVRVDNPRELARLVLAADPKWQMDAIDAAIAAGKTVSVPLPHAIPVYIFYWTAYVDTDGTVEFRDDVYSRDKRLNQALIQRDQGEQLTPARAGLAPGQG
jgi:murein L,D-transpeptidase YcbB/YkuD